MKLTLLRVFALLLAALLAGCSYKGAELWRRSACDSIVDIEERDKCIEDATRSENEYRQDVESVTQ